LDLCHDLAAQGSVIHMFLDTFHFAAPPASAALTSSLDQPGLLFLILAAFCLMLALVLMKRVLQQVGSMIRAVAGAGVVTFLLIAALALLAMATVAGR
jgi:hypothetical protein